MMFVMMDIGCHGDGDDNDGDCVIKLAIIEGIITIIIIIISLLFLFIKVFSSLI